MNSLNGKNIIKKYSFLLGFIILIVIISRIDLFSLTTALKKIQFSLILVGLFLTFPQILIKAWRWNYLKKIQGINYKLLDSFLIYNIGFLMGSITPVKIGELTKVLYLKNDGNSVGKSALSVILERLADVVYLLIFGYLAAFFALKEINKINTIYFITLFLLIFIITIIKKGWHRLILKKMFYILVPKNYQQFWRNNFFDFLNDLKKISPKNYVIVSIITIVIWLIYYLQVYLFALGLKLNISFIHLTAVTTITSLVVFLPVSWLGIGTRDAAYVILLQPLVSEISMILILSQLILLINIIVLIMGVIAWKLKPIPFKKQDE